MERNTNSERNDDKADMIEVVETLEEKIKTDLKIVPEENNENEELDDMGGNLEDMGPEYFEDELGDEVEKEREKRYFDKKFE
ncbi:hypothetical protein SAMN02745248_00294 [Hathewaya proteolytica DSM 3090]|uniref:Uncharacterized protein n=1 Tax=Hathewaya proteolytica DSM 3090 TaxID=1121331 RepID=A0A1M6JRD8_9CLOT|nr:hypothetical protein [Hathewaya proteolytica]SHJ49244.1 hypothetical protein SAMN02745248_00294 [Hathewaya proteolytica DSM 3090]